MALLALFACWGDSTPSPDSASADPEGDDIDTSGDTGEEPAPVSLLKVTNATDVAAEGFQAVYTAKPGMIEFGYWYIAPGDTRTHEADVEGQAWLGFDDADGNCAAFEVRLDYDTPVAVTITGFAGTWSWQTLSCE